MTYTQVVEEIRRWKSSDKWLLLETLLRDLRAASREGAQTPQRLSQQQRLRIAKELHGSIRPTEGAIPTDEDVRRIIGEERFGKYM
ncbi:MAG: hypothetical protein M1546_10570 [Chloroflexi bacterium]|nr:hypothetical protein [Chloroflexota bacterium]